MSYSAYITDVIGISGVILLLYGYYLLNTDRLNAHNLSYQLLNFTGSGLILFSLFFTWNLSAALIEIAWMLISLIGIYRILRA